MGFCELASARLVDLTEDGPPVIGATAGLELHSASRLRLTLGGMSVATVRITGEA